jgi:hypothetical protein
MNDTDAGLTEVPIELVELGIDWANQCRLTEQKPVIRDRLRAGFLNSLQLFEFNRLNLVQEIGNNGGFERLSNTDTYLGETTYNSFKCQNGKNVQLSRFMILPPVEIEVKNADETRGFAKQHYTKQLSFGGGFGFTAVDAHEADYSSLVGTRGMYEVFHGKYIPNCVAVTEAVVTNYDSLRPADVAIDYHQQVAHGQLYQIEARTWEAKLRPEFAPDPFKDPEGYDAWMHEQPIIQLEVAFKATSTPASGKQRLPSGTDFGTHPNMQTYLHPDSYVELTVAAVERMDRFMTVLGQFWHQAFGRIMPQPGYPTSALHSGNQPELPA